ncbi:MAG TPA: DUF5666 domain-containing protein [Anaerolineales bacterium]|nr:DUF5666 domain-containing protein [Anaerolineales bacterium]
MNTRSKSVIRWPLVVGYLGMVILLVACATSEAGNATQVSTERAALHLDNGAVEMLDENGNWIPVGGETTFEIAGELESTDPWMVTGNTFAARESTHVDEGLEAGDLVKVKGVILEDATWLASTIERVAEQTSPTIILIGKVMSIDPWVVNGMTLNVTGDTLISEGIIPEMIVRVEILLLEAGTWEVLSIVPLGDFTDVPGCATVTATVAAVNGNEIRFEGWPAITLGSDVKIENDGGGEGTLSVNQVVLIVVCASENGQIMITHIVILNTRDNDAPGDGGGEKVLICHMPDKKGGHTLSISASAVSAHLGHGDKPGPCP